MSDLKRTNIFDYYKLFDREIKLFYKGLFDKHILSTIGNYIKAIIGDNTKLSRKVFGIFIELAQNISFYSDETTKVEGKDVGIGSVIIAEQENYYYFSTGNIVRNADIYPLIDKCRHINTLDREGLRKYKREQRNLPQGPHDNAHIGLIQVALTSANPLDISVTPFDEYSSFFAITVKIEK